ncbi:MAG: hypothetical protein P1U87_11520 [Verrucomicrobiales bacterium]|nr:hypothetical protein [Verrucomicrobiales bacterium]
MNARRTRLSLVAALLCFTHSPGISHDSLYDYLEIRFLENNHIEVTLSVHAADFSNRESVDLSSVETDWFRALPPSEKAELIARANQSVSSAVAFSLQEGNAPDTTFPVPTIPRTATIDSGARPGSLIASAILPESADRLVLRYSGEKRLMVVVIRPGAFPKVHDLAPDSTGEFPLRPAPEQNTSP